MTTPHPRCKLGAKVFGPDFPEFTGIRPAFCPIPQLPLRELCPADVAKKQTSRSVIYPSFEGHRTR